MMKYALLALFGASVLVAGCQKDEHRSQGNPPSENVDDTQDQENNSRNQ